MRPPGPSGESVGSTSRQDDRRAVKKQRARGHLVPAGIHRRRKQEPGVEAYSAFFWRPYRDSNPSYGYDHVFAFSCE